MCYCSIQLSNTHTYILFVFGSNHSFWEGEMGESEWKKIHTSNKLYFSKIVEYIENFSKSLKICGITRPKQNEMWIYDLWAKSNLFCDYNTVCVCLSTRTHTFWKFRRQGWNSRTTLPYLYSYIYYTHRFLWLRIFPFLFLLCFHTHVRFISREHGINKKCQFYGSQIRTRLRVREGSIGMNSSQTQ